MAVCQNLVPLVNIKIAGKWMFIPLELIIIGFDPPPHVNTIFMVSNLWSRSQMAWPRSIFSFVPNNIHESTGYISGSSSRIRRLFIHRKKLVWTNLLGKWDEALSILQLTIDMENDLVRCYHENWWFYRRQVDFPVKFFGLLASRSRLWWPRRWSVANRRTHESWPGAFAKRQPGCPRPNVKWWVHRIFKYIQRRCSLDLGISELWPENYQTSQQESQWIITWLFLIWETYLNISQN